MLGGGGGSKREAFPEESKSQDRDVIRAAIVEEIKKATFFSALADAASDYSSLEDKTYILPGQLWYSSGKSSSNILCNVVVTGRVPLCQIQSTFTLKCIHSNYS